MTLLLLNETKKKVGKNGGKKKSKRIVILIGLSGDIFCLILSTLTICSFTISSRINMSTMSNEELKGKLRRQFEKDAKEFILTDEFIDGCMDMILGDVLVRDDVDRRLCWMSCLTNTFSRGGKDSD